MESSISTLIRSDFDQLDQLLKKNSKTLGFLPREALYSYWTGQTFPEAPSQVLLSPAYPGRFSSRTIQASGSP